MTLIPINIVRTGTEGAFFNGSLRLRRLILPFPVVIFFLLVVLSLLPVKIIFLPVVLSLLPVVILSFPVVILFFPVDMFLLLVYILFLPVVILSLPVEEIFLFSSINSPPTCGKWLLIQALEGK